MIKVLIGDMFESNAQTWVNTVNCVGVMGKGIALGFKTRFPEMFADYVRRCQRREVRLGRPYLYKRLVFPWVLNFPTKDHWRSVARLDSIVQGVDYLLENYQAWGISSLAVPPLGCGEGQLEWRIVGPTLYRRFSRLEIPIELYAPYGTPHEELQPAFLARETPDANGVSMPEPRWVHAGLVALVDILRRIEEQPYHWPVGRTTFQKIAYVATQEGIPTGLEYKRSSYGPFAPALKGVVTRLVNNGLIVESRLGQMFAVNVGPTFSDARQSYAEHLQQWESILNRVADLFLRMDTQQAEVTATVLFTARALRAARDTQPTECEVLAEVMQWKQRRTPPLDEKTVATAIRDLGALGWLHARACDDLPVSSEEDWLYA